MPNIRRLLCSVSLILASFPFVAGAADDPNVWPFAIQYQADTSTILAWAPPEAKHVRAMLVILNNSDSKNFGEHPRLREILARQETGIVYLRVGVKTGQAGPDAESVDGIFGAVAAKTGIADFRHAPWITFGKSASGKFPFHMAWKFPKRTIATISYHAETPTWPAEPWARLDGESVLHVNSNGETEWGGTWFIHVRPSLLNYRAKSAWLPHQVVARDVGHGDYVDAHGGGNFGKLFPDKVTVARVWDYLALYAGKAVALRVPKDKYPADGPVKLKQVDESAGYLIDPFAVEDLFNVPHLPLEEKAGVYLPGKGGDDANASGFVAMSPPKDFAAPDGVPVVKYESGKSPRQWILTDSLKFPMKADPMLELGDLAKLMPRVGDGVTIDGKALTFAPIIPKYVGPNGGIALKTGLRPTNGKITLLAYTILEMPEKKNVLVQAGYTAATRIQMVINGVPVKHKQVLELQPGRYPMLVVLRMTANWDRIEPALADASPEIVALGKQIQIEADRQAAELAKMKAAGAQPPKVLFRKAADVDKDARRKMFWVADREQAEAWLKLHNVNDQKITIP
jgi:hypothetical protein